MNTIVKTPNSVHSNFIRILLFILIILIFFNPQAFATEAIKDEHTNRTQAIATSELESFENYPSGVKKMIVQAMQLAKMNLTYQYGSAQPSNKGMDCSGTINYLLTELNVSEVPRSSDQIYKWALEKGHFHAVNSNDFNSPEFSELKPGDLLFWSGTYEIKRELPITHVMIYLGKNKQQQPLMFGASDGRTYQKKKIWGVSVFDLILPVAGSPSHFVGYSCIPTLTCK